MLVSSPYGFGEFITIQHMNIESHRTRAFMIAVVTEDYDQKDLGEIEIVSKSIAKSLKVFVK